MAETSGREKREHIRVNDLAVFKYYEPGINLNANENRLAKVFFSESRGRYYSLCKGLYEIDMSTKVTKAQAPIFDAMNQKIRLLMNSIYPNEMNSKQLINISDGGVGFNGNFEVKTQNSFGYVMLILDNYPVPLFIRGEFVYCIKTKDRAHAFKIGFKFDKDALDCIDIIKERVQQKFDEKALRDK